MGQVSSNNVQWIRGEAEDDKERPSHYLLLSPPSPTSQNESSTSSGALLQTSLSSSPSSDSCSDLSTSGSSPSHYLLLSPPSPTLQNESITSSGALLQTSLSSSPSSDSCSDLSTSGSSPSHYLLLSPPSPTSQNESSTSSGALLQTSLSSSPNSDSCSDLSTSGSSVHLSSLDLHGDSTTSTSPPHIALDYEQLLKSLVDILSNSTTYVPTHLGVDSNIEVVEKKRQAVPPPSHINSIEPRGKERERKEEKVSKGLVIKERWIKHYSSHQNILLLGEGDFSFSACLAVAFGSANNMIATSLNSKGFLRKNYGEARSNIEILRSRGCKVMHGVDATEMANHLLLKAMKFNRIIFNFPHAGFFRDESSKSELRRHRELVRQFLANAKKMITRKGEIHISHKSNGFFLAWNVEFLASQAGLRLIEAVDFNLNDYPGYHTKYGFGGDKNFDCNPSKTYKFGLKKQRKVESTKL